MSAPFAVKGWCPGALRPMPSGDGLLVRVRSPAGRLGLEAAEVLAAVASDCGNGTIEISSRANLQLRGVAEAKLAELQDGLAGIGLIDRSAGSERVRNVIASPLGDLDPEAVLDVAPLALALEGRLAADEALHELPAKFGFAIDGGGLWPLGDVEADVGFEAFEGPEGARFALRLDGSSGRDSHCAVVAPNDFPETAIRLARAFLDFAAQGADPPRRMRRLVEREGAGAVLAAAGLRPELAPSAPRRAAPRGSVGVLPLRGSFGFGVAPPFGRTRAGAFAQLARLARAEGATGLRLTPWRTMIVVGLDAARARRLAEPLGALGFVVAADDPRLAVVACAGAPACAHAERDTQADAREFSRFLPRSGGVALHVSGCGKGCARAAPTPLTLVAGPEGYDLVVDGRAADPPSRRGLSFASAAALVKSFADGLAA